VASSMQTETADIRVRDVSVTEDELSVALMDGRTISVPLAWYPRLANATPEQRARWELAGAGYGIHWPDVDEDLSTEGLLRGAPAPRGSERQR
jgi:Protein of unknown function (DUF2442)